MEKKIQKMCEMGLKMEKYSFQNIYLITTYRCNWTCDFCLFRFNKEREASLTEITDRILYSINDSPKKVYIKITGGEPFLKLDLLERVFKIANTYKQKVYKIGIGTNGSISLPPFFNDTHIRTHIFLSRHNMRDDLDLPLPKDLLKIGNINNPYIDFRINCNLIRGGIDNLPKIKKFVKRWVKHGVDHFCFRELSRVNIDTNSMYPPQIKNYIKYYDKYLVPFDNIKTFLDQDENFFESRFTGNYYDKNHWYWYNYTPGKRISVKFRSIDETKLIEYNTKINSGIDEYVIHPDGTLTGCWDKELKLIKKGGEM